MRRSIPEWIEALTALGALWIHSGNPSQPHALLTSGKHSDGFVNCGLIIQEARLLDDASADLLEHLRGLGADLSSCDWVIGPAMGAVCLAHDIARHIGCKATYTAKHVDDEVKSMVFERSAPETGSHVLAVEDVITTGDSTRLMIAAIEKRGAVALPYICCLVNRSGLDNIDGRRIVALVDQSMPIWEAGECPLCKQGSKAIRPKDGDNWERLTTDS